MLMLGRENREKEGYIRLLGPRKRKKAYASLISPFPLVFPRFFGIACLSGGQTSFSLSFSLSNPEACDSPTPPYRTRLSYLFLIFSCSRRSGKNRKEKDIFVQPPAGHPIQRERTFSLSFGFVLLAKSGVQRGACRRRIRKRKKKRNHTALLKRKGPQRQISLFPIFSFLSQASRPARLFFLTPKKIKKKGVRNHVSER